MRKNSYNFKIPSNTKTPFHEYAKSQVENISARPSCQNIQRRKQSLQSSHIKSDAGLMAQIKQALKTKQVLVPDDIENRLKQAKKIMYEDRDRSKYRKKENRAHNNEDRQTTFRDNLKQMQTQISSLKKLMEYQKARNHKIFEQKLFTVEQKFQDNKQMDDKLQFLKDLVQESIRSISNQKKVNIQQTEKGDFVRKEQYQYLKREHQHLKSDIESIKGQIMTVQDVDKRVTQSLEIFKAFLIQNIDKNVFETVNNKTSQLDKAYRSISIQIQKQNTTFFQAIQKSGNELLQQINALREEIQQINIPKLKQENESVRFQEVVQNLGIEMNNRIQAQITKIRQEWAENIDNCQARISLLENQILNINYEVDNKINPLKEQFAQMTLLLNDVISVMRTVSKKVNPSKSSDIDKDIITIIRDSVKDIEWLKKQIQNLSDQVRQLQSRSQYHGKGFGSKIITLASLQKSGEILVEGSFESD